MTRRDPYIAIRHMLDHSREAVELVRGRSREELDSDRLLNLALVRLLEIVGEAATRIPDGFRSRYPHIPWQDVADLRNRLIHGYDIVDFDILWEVVSEDLGPLIEQLKSVLSNR